MTDKTSLGDRMKSYEAAVGTVLLPRTPTIIRVDGKAFHTFTKRITPFNDPSSQFGPSEMMHKVMMLTAQAMCSQMQNVAVAYTQSDEISFLLRDYDRLESQQWFGGKVQKIASVSASMAAAYFNYMWGQVFDEWQAGHIGDIALFDSRVFQIPKDDVVNYFVWRQKDATRNSINFIARKYFSHKRLHGLNTDQVQELLWKEHEINWSHFDNWKKRGACVKPNPDIYSSVAAWVHDDNIPVFTQDRHYIGNFVEPNDGWANERTVEEDHY